jgi:hypothetical protein
VPGGPQVQDRRHAVCAACALRGRPVRRGEAQGGEPRGVRGVRHAPHPIAVRLLSFRTARPPQKLTSRGYGRYRVSCTAGLSLGEYTALVFAGVLSFEDGLKVVKCRAENMAAAAKMGEPHGMLTVVGLGDADLENICKTVRHLDAFGLLRAQVTAPCGPPELPVSNPANPPPLANRGTRPGGSGLLCLAMSADSPCLYSTEVSVVYKRGVSPLIAVGGAPRPPRPQSSSRAARLF